MCQKLGESITAPLIPIVAATGMTSDGLAAKNVFCNRTECPSYGKWWCPFTGW